jgi:hypothetical protein
MTSYDTSKKEFIVTFIIDIKSEGIRGSKISIPPYGEWYYIDVKRPNGNIFNPDFNIGHAKPAKMYYVESNNIHVYNNSIWAGSSSPTKINDTYILPYLTFYFPKCESVSEILGTTDSNDRSVILYGVVDSSRPPTIPFGGEIFDNQKGTIKVKVGLINFNDEAAKKVKDFIDYHNDSTYKNWEFTGVWWSEWSEPDTSDISYAVLRTTKRIKIKFDVKIKREKTDIVRKNVDAIYE